MPLDRIVPVIAPLGAEALLVRFGSRLTEGANRAAIAFAQLAEARPPRGVHEVQGNLVSVLLRYAPAEVEFQALAGEVRLLLTRIEASVVPDRHHAIPVRFGGADGPDLEAAARALAMSPDTFVAEHNRSALRVLATGFAPGFVYCGFHPGQLHLPRRREVRAGVPAGSILFAAGQTAISATPIPTGWHVIGRSDFRNFQPDSVPPTQLLAGDRVGFLAAPP